MDQLVEAVQVVAVHEDLQRTGNPPTGDQSFFTETRPPARTAACYPLPGLVFEERSYDGVERVDVPGLVDKMDPSKPGGETVLQEDERKANTYHIDSL